MTDKKDTKFQRGQSGNPGGRPVGAGNKIRSDLLDEWEEIRPILVGKAKEGEAWAVRIVAERICPPLRPSEEPVKVALTGDTLSEKAGCVIAALSDGSIAPAQAAQLLQGLGALAKIIEVDELQKRIEALEAKQ